MKYLAAPFLLGLHVLIILFFPSTTSWGELWTLFMGVCIGMVGIFDLEKFVKDQL